MVLLEISLLGVGEQNGKLSSPGSRRIDYGGRRET